MRNKIGRGFILAGSILLMGALALLLYNQAEAARADKHVSALVPQLTQAMGNPRATPEPDGSRIIPVSTMKEVIIDGNSYIGILSIPALDLELPVMSDWSYPQLKIAPCRYHGSVWEDNLVLMAHNYKKHFGRLSELREGDAVVFTDVDGAAAEYVVVGQDVLMPNAIEEMIAGEYDLTLFTCTYGGKSRETVYLDRSDH